MDVIGMFLFVCFVSSALTATLHLQLFTGWISSGAFAQIVFPWRSLYKVLGVYTSTWCPLWQPRGKAPWRWSGAALMRPKRKGGGWEELQLALGGNQYQRPNEQSGVRQRTEVNWISSVRCRSKTNTGGCPSSGGEFHWEVWDLEIILKFRTIRLQTWVQGELMGGQWDGALPQQGRECCTPSPSKLGAVCSFSPRDYETCWRTV